MSNENSAFDTWAVVELFGHQQIAGKVTEQVIAGQGFVRVDVPAVKDQEPYTRLFGPGAIYSIIPTSAEIVAAFVAKKIGAPIQPWQLQQPDVHARLPLPTEIDDEEIDYEEAEL